MKTEKRFEAGWRMVELPKRQRKIWDGMVDAPLVSQKHEDTAPKNHFEQKDAQ